MKYVINGYKNDDLYRQIFVVIEEKEDKLILKDELNNEQIEVGEIAKGSFIEITEEQYYTLKSKWKGPLSGTFYYAYANEVIVEAMKVLRARG